MLASLHGHLGIAWSAVFSADGKTLISAGEDGTIRFWNLAAVDEWSGPYTAPQGDVAALMKFVQQLHDFRPQTYHQHVEHGTRAPESLRVAAQRILKQEQNRSAGAYQVASELMLKHRVSTLAEADEGEQARILADVKTYLVGRAEKELTPADASLAAATAAALESSESMLAESANRSFGKLLAASPNPALAGMAKTFEGAANRCSLLGKELNLAGTTLDGTALDWNAYRGKVVLLDFCNTQSHPWRLEWANARNCYQLFHERGFEVIRISSDTDRGALEEFMKAEEPAWGVTLHERNAARLHPLAMRYGVTSYPSGWLVDKAGKVVSLRAVGRQLQEELTRLLGPPVTPSGKLSHIDLQPYANRDLARNWFGASGNHLGELTRGLHTLAGVKFNIGEKAVQLGNKEADDAPDKVAGIAVNQTVGKLYILHSAERAAWNVPVGAFIGRYEVRYEDQSLETIYIVKGQDVDDWWGSLHAKPMSRGKVAWVGQNTETRKWNRYLRLFLCEWENPKPEKKVASIDFISTKTTHAAPFCVAITAEAPAADSP
jgi:hypothetical protein